MSAVSSAPDAAGSSRALHREGSAASDEGDTDTRRGCLRRVSVERKKCVQLVAAPRLTRLELDAAFARCGVRHAPARKDTHRLFV